MKIIILGAGQVGRTAAQHLAREAANDVTVVDTDERLLRDLQDRIDIRTVQGNAASPQTLESAGARFVWKPFGLPDLRAALERLPKR